MTEIWNDVIVHPLINALVFLYDVLFHDFGIAIVVVTVVLRLALYPIFLTQLRSQRATQELAPALAELKKKYKDRQKFAEEQMKLYKERGINPASGCLPLVVQMPILFGLYSALSQVGCGLGIVGGGSGNCPGLTREALDMILYPFIANPIDPGEILRTVSVFLPWSDLGLAHPDPFHVLPIVAGAVQLIASLMTLPAKAPATQDSTQRVLQGTVYYLPLITVYFAWTFPAGLAVYWIATTVFSIAQQFYVSGWGKLASFVPLLARIPSPSAPLMARETQEAREEIAQDLSRETGRREGRRRRRR